MIRKLVSWAVGILITIFFILHRPFIIKGIINWDLEMSSSNAILLFIIILVEILVLFALYDYLVIMFYSSITANLRNIGKNLLKKENTKVSMFIIRVDYYILRLVSFLRLGWVRYDTSNLNPVWLGISKLTLIQKFYFILSVIISLPVVLALVMTSLILNWIDIEWINNQWGHILKLLSNIYSVKIDIGEIFSKLPTVVALLVLIPTFFLFYFYSQKREVRKIIEKRNNEVFKIVVDKHNNLYKLISNSIYNISENLNYIIRCQKLIADLIVKNHQDTRNIDDFHFKEIPEFREISNLIDELTNEELGYFTRQFSAHKYEIFYFYRNCSDYKKLEKLNRLFLTKQYFKEKFNNRRKSFPELAYEKLTTCSTEQQDILVDEIYDALKNLYSLYRYTISLERYLFSSNIEKTIMKTLLKEKQ